MAVYLVNYADGRYERRHLKDQQAQIKSALKIGFRKENIIAWRRSELEKTWFYKQHKKIFDIKKGSGLWLWNPFLVYKHLRGLEKSDILVFADSDIPFLRQIEKLIKVCELNNGMFFIKRKFFNKQYTKRYCLVKLGCDKDRYLNAYMVSAGFVILKKTDFTIRFYEEYLRLCCDVTLIDNKNYGIKNYPGFIEHRHPMSVLSLLHKKYGLNAFCVPGDPDVVHYETPKEIYKKMFNNYEQKLSGIYYGEAIIGGQLGLYKSLKKLAEVKSWARNKHGTRS